MNLEMPLEPCFSFLDLCKSSSDDLNATSTKRVAFEILKTKTSGMSEYSTVCTYNWFRCHSMAYGTAALQSEKQTIVRSRGNHTSCRNECTVDILRWAHNPCVCESPLSGKGTTCTAGLRSQQEIRFRMVQGHDWLESQTPISQEFAVGDISQTRNASGCTGCTVYFMLWHLVSFSDRSKCLACCKGMGTQQSDSEITG